MRPMGWCADLVLSSLDLLAIIAVIIPDVVCYVSWYHLLALWRDSCCLGGSGMRSLWTYQVKSIKYSLATARFVGILSLSSALYVDKGGIDVVLPSTAWRRYVHHRR